MAFRQKNINGSCLYDAGDFLSQIIRDMRKTCLDVLGGVLLLVNRGAGGGVGLGQLLLGAVDALLEDGLGLIDVELGLEVAEVVAEAAAVGAAAGVGQVETLVVDLFACVAPDDDDDV